MITIEQASRKSVAVILKKSTASFRKLLNRKDLGFLTLPEDQKWITLCKNRVAEIKNFQKMVVLGIGGSSLGGIVLKEFCQDEDRVAFFENVDGVAFENKIKRLDLESTHWVLISKSGKTIETLSQASFVSEFYEKNNLEFIKNCTVISELKSNPLSDWARKNKIPILEIPENVGGRFSVLSPVGLLPAAFLGLRIEDLFSGARWAKKQEKLVAEIAAQAIMSWSKKEWISVFWVYSEHLQKFGFWLAQLWAESLGKKKSRKNKKAPRVSTPIPLVGANDQHSVLQQIMEGQRDKFVVFFKAKKQSTGLKLKNSIFADLDLMKGKTLDALFEAETMATQESLDANKIPTMVISLDELNLESLGALFMVMQLVIGTLGEFLDINAFDQPGVEEGKKRTRAKLISLDKN